MIRRIRWGGVGNNITGDSSYVSLLLREEGEDAGADAGADFLSFGNWLSHSSSGELGVGGGGGGGGPSAIGLRTSAM